MVTTDAQGGPGGTLPLDARATVALGLFFAWQASLEVSAFMGAGLGALSPQLALALAACLSMLGVMRAQLADAPACVSASRRMRLGMAAMAAGSLAAVAGMLAPDVAALRYAAAVLAGAALTVGLFAWVFPLARLDARRRMGSLLGGALLSSGLVWAQSLLPMGVAQALFAACLGALALGALRVWGVRDEPVACETSYRPASAHHFRLLLVALAVYAFVFGSVAGSTASQTSATSMATLGVHVAQVGALVAAVCLAALTAARGPVRLELVGRVLTPLLAILFIVHIVLPDAGRNWLPPATLAVWQLVQAFVMLVLIDVSRSGVGSLGLVFSGGWALLAGGFAVGSLFGGVSGVLFGLADDAVNAITVLHTALAVVASSLLAAARYPKVEAEEDVPSGEAQGPAGAPVAASAPAADGIAQACEALAARHALSERECEVLELLARGNTRQSIASKLVVSENTVRTHVKNIYAKLHIHSKQQLIDLVDSLRG